MRVRTCRAEAFDAPALPLRLPLAFAALSDVETVDAPRRVLVAGLALGRAVGRLFEVGELTRGDRFAWPVPLSTGALFWPLLPAGFVVGVRKRLTTGNPLV